MIADGFHLDFTIKISTSQNSDFAFDFIRVSKLYCSTWLTEGDSSFKVCVTRVKFVVPIGSPELR